MNKKLLKPDFLFEVSWEVCNKIGGIHTVISSKALLLSDQLKDNYITIGPDVWKETHEHPEFIEDPYLFRSWRDHATDEGLHMRIGRWQIPGQPIAILVDFTPLFGKKDKIFTDFWLKYGLNSLSGQWDYTEPAMFGYAAAQLIESFYSYHLASSDSLVAHFHEWMTGTGVLYLHDKVPQCGTIFTTHATVIGRSMAGHGKALYNEMESVEIEHISRDLGVQSKHSLEQESARNADVFTTVGAGTARECEIFLGRKPDLVTPNGFDASYFGEVHETLSNRIKGREKLLKVANSLLGENLAANTLLIAHSGRYEFRNKGIDLFIDALGKLNTRETTVPVVAFILVPGNQTGPCQDLAARIGGDSDRELSSPILTHNLADPDTDAILNSLKKVGLENRPGDKVRVIFTPAYLSGQDGIYNMEYFELLPAFDATVFPSYYEPWGYTPMESIAMGIPSVTTTRSGFSLWATEHYGETAPALHILNRNDGNEAEFTEKLSDLMFEWAGEAPEPTLTDADHPSDPVSHTHLLEARIKSREIASLVRWEKQITYYQQAFHEALEESAQRHDLYRDKKQPVHRVPLPPVDTMRPKWKKITIEVNVPKKLNDLPVLARNIWWTWNYDAQELFERIDPTLWAQSQKNPITLMDKLSMEHFDKLIKDQDFMASYKRVTKMFHDYMKAGESRSSGKIAYFSMEYGLHETIKIYSGGLGVLAGDYLKQASDDNVDMVGIGLLYRYGYFTQNLSAAGEQIDTYEAHDFGRMSALPVRDKDGNRIKISIALPGRTLHARVYRIDVGRVPLYLLDTDLSENIPVDRFITHQLYGGDWENRFKQEFLLGIGGIRLLDALGIKPAIFHCNEGHAAFTGLERLRKYVQDEKLTFSEAVEVVRSSSLFTTHTPVPAGHDFFSEDMLRTYMPHYADRLGISWEEFMGLGKMDPLNMSEDYSMSVLAAKLAQHINGVSLIHGKVSRVMFKDLYPGYFPEEVHIGHVTNGVHYGTWTDKEWQKLYTKTFGEEFLANVSDPSVWEKIYDVPNQTIWEIRNKRRSALLEFIRNRLLANLARRQETPRKIYQMMEAIDHNTLTIGFARRFATYKRAHLIFNDLDRLAKIVNNPDMPVQFIYAGKAHPADKAGQELIRHILEISRREEFMGKILFLEDYDMELGRELVKGVDIWLNTPTRPQEASGTSGQKAVLNGVMNFSVLDGWWAEGYTEEAGWMLKEEKTFDNQDFQNELDAETIYNVLESEIVPMFYGQDRKGVPVEWVRWIKNCIARIAPHYTNKRMLNDYFTHFYDPLFDSAEKMQRDEYALARKLSRWKSRIMRGWDSIAVVDRKLMGNSGKSLLLGEPFKAELVLDFKELKNTDFGVEVVFVQKSPDGSREIVSVYEMERLRTEGSQVSFSCEVAAKRAGVFNYAFRLFPRHSLLSHRQDFNLVKWI